MRKYVSMFLLFVLGILLGYIINDYFQTHFDVQIHQEDRFWSVYSNHYKVMSTKHEGDQTIYSICSAQDKDVCIDLIESDGTIVDYLNTIAEPTDRMPEDFAGKIGEVDSSLHGRLQWTCTRMYESTVCFNQSSRGLLIMKIDDQIGIGFHGGEGYNAKDVLEVIGY